jgi:hypothetical protein
MAQQILNDGYSQEILAQRFNSYRNDYVATSELIQTSGLPIRHQNPPEDITENIVKFIIRNHDNDPLCQWAKSIRRKGDLYSPNYPANSQPEVKAFTSGGPSSFGPAKKFGVLYFLDMRNWLTDVFVLWKVNVTNESPEWRNIRMNETQTLGEQCDAGRRPHIQWDGIHQQIPDRCTMVYNGPFEGIFAPLIVQQ